MAMRALLGMLFALAGVGGAAAMDVPVATKRLVVKDSARPRLVQTVKGAIPTPTPGGADDPQVTGAVLEVYGALAPPTPLRYVGELLVNPLQLSTASAVASDADGFFCPSQRTPGAFGLATARTIRVAGSPLLGGPTLFSTTLAGTFCVPSSGNPLVDDIEDLPGPGAVSVPGSVSVCLGVLCL